MATPFEVRQIERNEALLCLIRARLHQAAGRHEDRLVFDLQTTVAESFGYRSQAPDGSRLPMRASETPDAPLLLGGKAVSQLSQILLLNIERAAEPIDPRTTPDQRAVFFEKRPH